MILFIYHQRLNQEFEAEVNRRKKLDYTREEQESFTVRQEHKRYLQDLTATYEVVCKDPKNPKLSTYVQDWTSAASF